MDWVQREQQSSGKQQASGESDKVSSGSSVDDAPLREPIGR